MIPFKKKDVSAKSSNSRSFKRSLRNWGIISGVTFLVIFIFYSLLVDAPPPDKIAITSGGETGLYYRFAQLYSEKTEPHGVTLDVSTSAGTTENLNRLLDPDSGFSAGIVQGGVVQNHPEKDKILTELRSLGSLYREPLWVFYRADSFPEGLTQLSQLGGKRISAGATGSGTFPVAAMVLRELGLDITNPDNLPAGTTLHGLGGSPSAEGLIAGELDVAFMVVGLAGYVKTLLLSEGIEVFSFDNWEVFTRKYPFLTHITLPQGMVDLRGNVPSQTINLLAPVATLVVREDLHSALHVLLTMIIDEVHRDGDEVFALPDEFPSRLFVDIPVSDAADRYYRNGPPTLQRLLGFQWAIWVDRVKLMIIPLLMLLMPLFKLFPPILRWRIRSKIYKWYAVIREVDMALKEGSANEKLCKFADKLTEIEAEVANVAVPLSYMNEFYSMRFHLAFIRDRLKAAVAGEPEPMVGSGGGA